MQGGITIRHYKPSDYPAVIEVWNQTDLGGAQRGDNQAIIEHSIAMGGCMFIAETNDGAVVGTSWMTFDGRRIHLHHIGVKPDFQRKGIGRMLTEQSINFAKVKGYQIKLEVHKNNIFAVRLYKKLGFKYLGDYDVYIIRSFD
ncbi:MAG: GNAT family N-acetyltransferase [Tenuifilaceae bacterium]